MIKHILNLIIVAILISMCPLLSFADAKVDQAFQTDCNKAWMEMAGNTSDKDEYKNFGEKYCSCAAGKSLNSKDEIAKAAQICMSQTLLKDTMDGLGDSVGLKNLTQESIQTGCQDKWKIIYPEMDDKLMTSVTSYCQCASPKLMELNKNRDNVTDKQWYDTIETIANDCAGNVAADKTTTDIKTNG